MAYYESLSAKRTGDHTPLGETRHPEQGKGADLILPSCNTKATNLHLAEMQRRSHREAHAVLFADQAG